MRDAIGGLVNLVIIVVFLVIVSGYLAFNVNYTKAFKVKNKIISTFEEYEGNCPAGGECMRKIEEYMRSVGYDMTNTPSINNDRYSNYTTANGFIYLPVCEDSETSIKENRRCYYKVVTQITIDIPIINRIMSGINMFQVSGDTKTITYRVGENS